MNFFSLYLFWSLLLYSFMSLKSRLLFFCWFIPLSLYLPALVLCSCLCMSFFLRRKRAAQVLCRKATWSVINGQIRKIPDTAADANFCPSACVSCLRGVWQANTDTHTCMHTLTQTEITFTFLACTLAVRQPSMRTKTLMRSTDLGSAHSETATDRHWLTHINTHSHSHTACRQH